MTPQQLADRTAAQFERMGEALNARADDIIRTTQARHKEAALEIWRRMEQNGDIFLSKYAGWYSVRDEAYYDEGELTERDGKKYAPTERRSNGWKRKAGFSGSPPMATGCWRSTRRTPASSRPSIIRTRSSLS